LLRPREFLIGANSIHDKYKSLGETKAKTRDDFAVGYEQTKSNCEERVWTQFQEFNAYSERNWCAGKKLSTVKFDMRLFLYKPPARFTGQGVPVLVVIHGGPEDNRKPIFWGHGNYYLNELGIALIYPNVRG